MIAAVAIAMLLASDMPRTTPDIPKMPAPFLEMGNRHARRRDRKLGRQK